MGQRLKDLKDSLNQTETGILTDGHDVFKEILPLPHHCVYINSFPRELATKYVYVNVR